jgi:hypothetical protein
VHGIDKSRISGFFKFKIALSIVGFCAPVATTTTSAFVIQDAILNNLQLNLTFQLTALDFVQLE